MERYEELEMHEVVFDADIIMSSGEDIDGPIMSGMEEELLMSEGAEPIYETIVFE